MKRGTGDESRRGTLRVVKPNAVLYLVPCHTTPWVSIETTGFIILLERFKAGDSFTDKMYWMWKVVSEHGITFCYESHMHEVVQAPKR